MIDIRDINYTPHIDEISDYISNPFFHPFCTFLEDAYKPMCKIEYSKDVLARGWNIKFRKSGKSLCVVYPQDGYFTVLVVVGRKEKEDVELLLPQLSAEMQNIYRQTKEGNGQRWLMIDIKNNPSVYHDALTLIGIRRDSK